MRHSRGTFLISLHRTLRFTATPGLPGRWGQRELLQHSPLVSLLRYCATTIALADRLTGNPAHADWISGLGSRGTASFSVVARIWHLVSRISHAAVRAPPTPDSPMRRHASNLRLYSLVKQRRPGASPQRAEKTTGLYRRTALRVCDEIACLPGDDKTAARREIPDAFQL